MCVSGIVKNLNIKVFKLISRTNETKHTDRHKPLNANEDLLQGFVITNNVAIKINAEVNAKNLLINLYVRRNLFGILVVVSVNVINHVMLASI